MNKLVSKNPIYRFKEGKLIVKALFGIPLTYLDKLKLQNPESSSLELPLKFRYKGKIYSTYEGKVYNLDAQGHPKSEATGFNLVRDNNGKLRNIVQRNPLSEKTNVKETLELQKSNPSTEKNGFVLSKKTPVNNNSMFLSPIGGWKRSMGDKILDTESLNMLKELGWTGNAGEILRLLNQNNIGGYEVREDSRWGNQSKSALKAYYDRWKKSLNLLPKVTYVSPQEAIKSPEVLLEMKNWMNLEAISQNPTMQTDLNIINNNNLSFKRNANLNKSLTRDLMRSFGLDPYAFSGALRKALRLYKNGLSDDISLLRGTPLYDLFVTPYLYKKGGLISRNPVERFKISKGLYGLIAGLVNNKKKKLVNHSTNDFGLKVVETTITNRGYNPFKTPETITQEVTYNTPEGNDTVYTYTPSHYLFTNPQTQWSNNWRTMGYSERRPTFERLRELFNKRNFR